MSWVIQLYESPAGQTPVEDFINALQPSTKAKLISRINLLAEFGPGLGMPNAKLLGGGLYELRIRGKEEVRTIYVYQKARRIVLLHAFKKKTMAISKKDLSIALERKRELDKS